MNQPITSEAARLIDAASSDVAARRAVFRLFRKCDESHLWPISGRFNATERAIRRLRRYERNAGRLSPLEVAYWLDDELSRIVNSEV